MYTNKDTDIHTDKHIPAHVGHNATVYWTPLQVHSLLWQRKSQSRPSPPFYCYQKIARVDRKYYYNKVMQTLHHQATPVLN